MLNKYFSTPLLFILKISFWLRNYILLHYLQIQKPLSIFLAAKLQSLDANMKLTKQERAIFSFIKQAAFIKLSRLPYWLF